MALDRIASAVALFHLYLDQQRYDEIHALVEEYGSHESWTAWSRLADAKQFPDKLSVVMDWANRFESSNDSPKLSAYINTHLYLGDVGKALEKMKQRIPYDATWYTFFWWPDVAHVRKHPAFKAFARDMGLLKLWQARGWPDLCRPLGEDDFECD